MTNKLKFQVRRYTAEDANLVFSSWLKSNLANTAYKQIPPETYHYQHHRLIESYLGDATTATVIAYDPENPRFVYGWLSGQIGQRQNGSVSPIIHFVYVKQNFRRLGVATELLQLFGVNQHVAAITTHWTPKGDVLLKSMNAVALYNPYLAWGRAPVMDPVPQNLTVKEQRLHDKAIKASRRELAFGGYVPTPKESV